MIRIYHNPRCRKSRETLHILENACKGLEIIDYLKEPPTPQQLKEITKKLGIAPEALVRKNEDLYKEKFKGKKLSDEQWLKVLSENPKLIERPIVVKGQKAVVGRPPENVNQLL